MLGGSLMLGTSTLMFAGASSVEGLVFSRLLQGLAASANFTPALALLSDLTPESTLGEVLGEVTGWSGLGMLLGPPLGGVLYSWVGYSFPFIVGSVFCFLQAALVYFLLEESKHKKASFSQDVSLIRLEFIQIIGVIVIGSASLTMLEPIVPLILQNKHSLSPLGMGVVFALVVVAFGVVSPVAGKVSDKAGRRPVITLGLVGMCLLLPMVFVPESLFLETVCLVCVGAASALVMVPTLPELADSVKKVESATYDEIYATFNSSYAVGNILGPLLGGTIAHLLGFYMALVAFSGIILCYLVFLFVPKKKKPHNKEADLFLNHNY